MSLEWKSCKIGDVVSVRRGASPRPIKDYVSESGMPWVKIADATKDQTRFINFTNEFIKEEGIEKSVVVYPGDLIVSNSATLGEALTKLFLCYYGAVSNLKFHSF